ncbi:antibiotic biosynthesis monooxygenase [Candidatus Nanopelagicales bacterium]|nr:antibiotic biosynthesis monooxygenase [Candidatus Nanopelagicales bacterium]
MLVLMRFTASDTSPQAAQSLQARQETLVQSLSAAPGFSSATLGRSPDVPEEWVVATNWDDTGSFRRGLSRYEVKLALGALAPESQNLTSVFEVIGEGHGTDWHTRASDRAADASTAVPGIATSGSPRFDMGE